LLREQYEVQAYQTISACKAEIKSKLRTGSWPRF